MQMSAEEILHPGRLAPVYVCVRTHACVASYRLLPLLVRCLKCNDVP